MIKLVTRLQFIFCAGVLLAMGESVRAQNAGAAPAPKPVPGTILTFEAATKETETTVVPSISLYVPEKTAPSPFVPAGAFVATWTGNINVDMRGEYSFQAELNGEFKLEINGETVLETKGENSTSPLGKSIRLNKGANPLKAVLKSPGAGDAFVRLHWKPKDSFLRPVELSAYTHAPTDSLKKSMLLRRGRELVVENRCLNCHQSGSLKQGMPELAMDAPAFDGIGSRRQADWMARWIEDPKSLRPISRMPKLLHGTQSKEESQAIASYLGSLKDEAKLPEVAISKELAEPGKKLYETLHCAACHTSPESTSSEPNKIPLRFISQKFSNASLVQFLKQPDQHFAWIRMPAFKLSDEQRQQLASYLESNSEKPSVVEPKSDSKIIEQGKKLVDAKGCLNCHNHKGGKGKPAKTWESLKMQDGCLAEKAVETAPFYAFDQADRDALKAFAATDHSSLKTHVPVEFAARQFNNLNCASCHGVLEGFPPLEVLGSKLKPEWAAKFIAGEISYKPRHWLEAQMPAFRARADLLAEGMVMQHGFAPKTAPEKEADKNASEIGNKLVSAQQHGGFSCISCHGVGTFGATEVFEAPGINLAYSYDRLQRQFFKRWIHNPTLIDPQSKMPVYFDDEGKSPLGDIYEGSAEKQILAIWEYLKLRDQMPPPKATQ